MALNDKNSGFGFGIEEKFKKVTTKTPSNSEKTSTDNHTHTYTHDYTHTHDDVREPEKQERKQKRVQLLTYESLINRIDKYAAKRGVSRVVVIEAALTAYLDKVDPQE